MPRRIPDYPDAFAGWNSISSVGSLVSFFGFLFFFYIVYDTLTGDRRAAPNPWTFGVDDPNQAMSLEWMLPSPPPFHTYEELTPIKDTVGVKA